MTEANKAIRPVETQVLSPLNEGNDFKRNSYITFRIGRSDLNMWLTNNSYLSLDLSLAPNIDISYKGTITDKAALPQFYIRNAANLFKQIEVMYGGKTIYSQPYNIEQNTIRMLGNGESYMNANYATYTTTSMVKNGIDYLKIGRAAADGTTANQTTPGGVLVKNVMIPINQLIPLFQDVTADGFPVINLKNQIEIRLYVADPHRYLCFYDDTVKDFSVTTGKKGAITVESDQLGKFDDVLKLTTVRMYCVNYIPDSTNAAMFENKCNSDNGWTFKYSIWHTALRQIADINLNNILPFNVVTENTRSIIAYCYKSACSPSVMNRPEIYSTSLMFGSNQIPAQPISGTTFETPFEYKFTVDDVLDNVDKYFQESNMDYNNSYRFIANGTADTAITVPTSSFVILGVTYTDTEQLGGNSGLWNSQYQLQFNATQAKSKADLTFVLGVKTEYGMNVKNGELDTQNY